MVPTKWSITLIENIFNQNKKLIAINNDWKTSGQRGVKMPDSTIKFSISTYRRHDFPIDPKGYDSTFFYVGFFVTSAVSKLVRTVLLSKNK